MAKADEPTPTTKSPASGSAPMRLDALGWVAFLVYMLIGGVFVFGFGYALRQAVKTQNETPCRSLAPLKARLVGSVVDADGKPVPQAQVVPTLDGRIGAPVVVRPDGSFSVFLPKGTQELQVTAPGKTPLDATVTVEPSQQVEVEVRLAAEGVATPSTLVERSRGPWEAPDLELTDLQGNAVRLSDFRGQLVVLNFWATWCEPCITEWPQLAKLAHRVQESGGDDVVVLAVSIDEDRSKIEPFLRLMSLFDSPVRVLWDETTKAHEALGSEKIPDTYFVDERGRVTAVFVNVREWGSPDALHCVESSVDD